MAWGDPIRHWDSDEEVDAFEAKKIRQQMELQKLEDYNKEKAKIKKQEERRLQLAKLLKDMEGIEGKEQALIDTEEDFVRREMPKRAFERIPTEEEFVESNRGGLLSERPALKAAIQAEGGTADMEALDKEMEEEKRRLSTDYRKKYTPEYLQALEQQKKQQIEQDKEAAKTKYQSEYLPKAQAEDRKIKERLLNRLVSEQVGGDELGLVSETGFFEGQKRLPSVREIYEQEKVKRSAEKELSELDDPVMKRYFALADATDDPITKRNIMRSASDYMSKKSIGEQSIAGKESLLEKEFAAKRELASDAREYDKEKMNKEFENEMSKQGRLQEYKQANIKLENSFKTARDAAKRELQKSESDKGFIKAGEKANSEIMKAGEKAFSTLQGLTQIESLIKSENPMAVETVKAFIARNIGGEIGVLTDKDIERYGGSRALSDRIKQTMETYGTGRWTEENKWFILDLANTIRDRKKEELEMVKNNAIIKSAKIYGVSTDKLSNVFSGYDEFLETGTITIPKDEPTKKAQPVSKTKSTIQGTVGDGIKFKYIK